MLTTGERIKLLRTARGMSQEELGRMIGVKKAAVHKYENGIVVNLKRSTIDKLSGALGTTPTYLLGLEEQEQPPHSGDCPDQELLVLLNRLDPEGQKRVKQYIRALLG